MFTTKKWVKYTHLHNPSDAQQKIFWSFVVTWTHWQNQSGEKWDFYFPLTKTIYISTLVIIYRLFEIVNSYYSIADGIKKGKAFSSFITIFEGFSSLMDVLASNRGKRP